MDTQEPQNRDDAHSGRRAVHLQTLRVWLSECATVEWQEPFDASLVLVLSPWPEAKLEVLSRPQLGRGRPQQSPDPISDLISGLKQ